MSEDPKAHETQEAEPVAKSGKSAAKKQTVTRVGGLPASGRIHITTSNGPDIEFDGEEIAFAEDYHGLTYKGVDKTYFVRLSIYTINGRGGEYVCVASYIDLAPNKNTKYKALVVTKPDVQDKIYQFFVDPKTKQPSKLAKDLYRRVPELRKKSTVVLN